MRSMEAVAVIRAIRGPKFGLKAGKSREVSTFINFEQPACLRATGVVPPTGRKAFDLASDGREFHLLAPDHDAMKFVVGQVDSQLNESDISDIDEMAGRTSFSMRKATRSRHLLLSQHRVCRPMQPQVSIPRRFRQEALREQLH